MNVDASSEPPAIRARTSILQPKFTSFSHIWRKIGNLLTNCSLILPIWPHKLPKLTILCSQPEVWTISAKKPLLQRLLSDIYASALGREQIYSRFLAVKGGRTR